ncbi:pilus assembly protein N-terminal domain-containing protein [Orrella sp. JC864]|uniref:type II and III secretion system protein family protein n=1 Tax=Orrella sp. JC864 TaxID=3120298 RepID=UPI003009EEDB
MKAGGLGAIAIAALSVGLLGPAGAGAQERPVVRAVDGPAAAAAQAPAQAAAQAAVREIALPVRGEQTLDLRGTPVRVSVGDPEVADVRVLPPAANRGGAILLLARKPGMTQVQVWLRGESQPQVWRVRVGSAVHGALDGRGLAPEANVDAAGGAAVISGQSSSMETHRRAVESAAASGERVADLSTIQTGGVVQVEVKVVELSTSVLKDVGLNFAAGSAAGGSGPWGGTATGLISSNVLQSGFNLLYDSRNFEARLGLLQSNGMARILAEPTLVALSGQSASFLAGGEIPVPESGGLGTQTISYKPFGIGLTVSPTVLSRDRIALKVAPEASELDPANGIPIINGDNVTLIPALRTRRADTTVELGDGESFVISGLVSRQTIANVSKMPFLGDLPIIGAFFRSVQYSQQDRELVIIVTPRLVRPIARGVSLPLPGASQERSDSMGNAWGYYLVGPLGGQQMPGFSH